MPKRNPSPSSGITQHGSNVGLSLDSKIGSTLFAKPRGNFEVEVGDTPETSITSNTFSSANPPDGKNKPNRKGKQYETEMDDENGEEEDNNYPPEPRGKKAKARKCSAPISTNLSNDLSPVRRKPKRPPQSETTKPSKMSRNSGANLSEEPLSSATEPKPKKVKGKKPSGSNAKRGKAKFKFRDPPGEESQPSDESNAAGSRLPGSNNVPSGEESLSKDLQPSTKGNKKGKKPRREDPSSMSGSNDRPVSGSTSSSPPPFWPKNRQKKENRPREKPSKRPFGKVPSDDDDDTDIVRPSRSPPSKSIRKPKKKPKEPAKEEGKSGSNQSHPKSIITYNDSSCVQGLNSNSQPSSQSSCNPYVRAKGNKQTEDSKKPKKPSRNDADDDDDDDDDERTAKRPSRGDKQKNNKPHYPDESKPRKDSKPRNREESIRPSRREEPKRRPGKQSNPSDLSEGNSQNSEASSNSGVPHNSAKGSRPGDGSFSSSLENSCKRPPASPSKPRVKGNKGKLLNRTNRKISSPKQKRPKASPSSNLASNDSNITASSHFKGGDCKPQGKKLMNLPKTASNLARQDKFNWPASANSYQNQVIRSLVTRRSSLAQGESISSCTAPSFKFTSDNLNNSTPANSICSNLACNITKNKGQNRYSALSTRAVPRKTSQQTSSSSNSGVSQYKTCSTSFNSNNCSEDNE